MNAFFPWLTALAFAIAPTAYGQDPQTTHATDDALIGLWGFETPLAPATAGELTIERKGSQWRATFAGAEVAFDVTSDKVQFAFPGEAGRFRGELSERGRELTGFWIRPRASDSLSGASQPFATPLTLKRSGRDTWRCTVRPLRADFTLHLRIFRGEDGALIGAFRNRERNSTGGAQHYQVARDGDTVQFTAGTDPAAPTVRHTAELMNADTLQLTWPDLNRRIALTRQTAAQATAFYPRPAGEPVYAYARPPETGDGWATAPARDVGIDEKALTQLVQKLIAGDPFVRRPSLIHSLLVARNGKLVLEEYFYGFDRDTPHDTRSAGKTFSSVMLGAAMRNGVDIAPETPAYTLLASRGPFANPDPRKAKITLAHLMTHTSGLACNDNDEASPGNEDTMQNQTAQPDWWKHTLDLPMAHEPGSRYAYCSANMNLVGAALTTATNTWLPELFERTVARPLQFGEYHWNLMPTDEGYLGGGAFLRSRDLLKVGQAYLDGGAWRGRRIVDSAWVTQSTAPRVEINPQTTGLDAEQFGEYYGEGTDAYAWHLSKVKSGDRVIHGYSAGGNGGQVLLVLPEYGLVVVFTGGNFRQGGIWGRWADEIVGGVVIPAIRR